ncbi:hypothetical protein ACQY0O_002370 [Thecaphora frezii]
MADVATTLNYCVPDDASPLYKYVCDPPAGVKQKNFSLSPYAVTVQSARTPRAELGGRSMKEAARLDQHGFQYVDHRSGETRFDDEQRIRDVYFREMEELIKAQVPGVRRVCVFDHTLRRLPKEPEERGKERGPLLRVHVDQTEEATLTRIRRHVPEKDHARLLEARIRIINVWRPLHAVEQNPLAVAEWRSVEPEHDFLRTRRFLPPHPEGQTYNVRHNGGHRWWFLPEQTEGECLLVKCYDSQGMGLDGTKRDQSVAWATPHTSFELPVEGEVRHRESIEVRCLCFDAE